MHVIVRGTYMMVDLRLQVPACMHAEFAPARRLSFRVARSAQPSDEGTSASGVIDCVRARLQCDVPDGPISCGHSDKTILTTDPHCGPNIAQTLALQLAHHDAELRLALLEAKPRASPPDDCQWAQMVVISVGGEMTGQARSVPVGIPVDEACRERGRKRMQELRARHPSEAVTASRPLAGLVLPVSYLRVKGAHNCRKPAQCGGYGSLLQEVVPVLEYDHSDDHQELQ